MNVLRTTMWWFRCKRSLIIVLHHIQDGSRIVSAKDIIGIVLHCVKDEIGQRAHGPLTWLSEAKSEELVYTRCVVTNPGSNAVMLDAGSYSWHKPSDKCFWQGQQPPVEALLMPFFHDKDMISKLGVCAYDHRYLYTKVLSLVVIMHFALDKICLNLYQCDRCQ